MSATSLSIPTHERLAVAALVSRIADRDRDLADHSLACGALSATLARMFGLSPDDVGEAAVLGTLHEIGTISVADDLLKGLPDAPEPAYLQVQRQIRQSTVALLHGDPHLSRYAEPAGTLFDDLVPTLTAKIVVVADIYDALVRHMPGLGILTKREALDVLRSMVGPRVDGEVVHALILSLRRDTSRSVNVPA